VSKPLNLAEYQDWFDRIKEISQRFYSSFPPKSETIKIIGPTPVSFRASRSDKELIEKAIKVQLNEIPWICTEDIEVLIQWEINDRERYENPSTPDADNILKPILDSLCGPKGIIIDDCQIVSLNMVCLGGWVHGHNQFDLTITLPKGFYDNHACIPKNEIQLIHIGKGLYFPVNKTLKSELDQVSYYLSWVETMSPDQSNEGSMPIRRFYHKSRVGQFALIEAEDFKKQLT